MGVAFSFYRHPIFSLFDPPGGPLDGNTTVRILGTFAGGSEYLCRFGNVNVNATYAVSAGEESLTCVSPSAREVRLQPPVRTCNPCSSNLQPP